MAPETFSELLTRQIGNAFVASHQYIAMAVGFDSQDLPRLPGTSTGSSWRSAITR